MTRLLSLVLALFLVPAAAFAADNGGFGSSFTGHTPSALTEAPNSTVAQTSIVQDPSSPEALQNIMPASGDETSPPTTDKAPALKPDAGLPKGEIKK